MKSYNDLPAPPQPRIFHHLIYRNMLDPAPVACAPSYGAAEMFATLELVSDPVITLFITCSEEPVVKRCPVCEEVS
jgi:hypothetical protein